MKNEAAFKTAFRKSVRRHKGFSLPLAAPMFAGIPDMYIIMPGYMPLLVEAKWLGEISRDKFSRKVPFSPLQMLWIKECHEVNPYSALGLIGCIYHDKVHAIFVVHGTPMFYQLSNCFLTDCAYTTLNRNKGGPDNLFDIPDLFARVPIPKLASLPRATDILEELNDNDNRHGTRQSSLAV